MKENRMNHQTPQTPESSLVNEDQKTWNDVEEQEYLERLSNFGEGYYDASSYFNFDDESGKKQDLTNGSTGCSITR